MARTSTSSPRVNYGARDHVVSAAMWCHCQRCQWCHLRRLGFRSASAPWTIARFIKPNLPNQPTSPIAIINPHFGSSVTFRAASSSFSHRRTLILFFPFACNLIIRHLSTILSPARSPSSAHLVSAPSEHSESSHHAWSDTADVYSC